MTYISLSPSIEQQMKKKKLKVELNTMLKKKGLGNDNISCFEDQDPSSPSCVFHIYICGDGVHASFRLTLLLQQLEVLKKTL